MDKEEAVELYRQCQIWLGYVLGHIIKGDWAEASKCAYYLVGAARDLENAMEVRRKDALHKQ